MKRHALDGDVFGATPVARGTRFGVVSLVADAVDVCVFDDDGVESRHPLTLGERGLWQGLVEGVGVGARYGFRARGDRERAPWCDPSRLLIDPYARAIEGADSVDHAALSNAPADTAPFVPRSVVVNDAHPWRGRARPARAWTDTVIYEAHVKGMTARHPLVDPALRGTYAGLSAEPVLAHLVELGVTAVELLPVHEFVDEGSLVARGLRNYWGYNPIAYFAPTARYSARARRGETGGQVTEFKEMVAAMHAAGLEVLLDVVYNHTAESGEHGPVLSFRGLDDSAYYRHDEHGSLIDTTGCGNTLDAANPVALALVLDSLRYWVQVCHVDGFRFDLAPALCRPDGHFDPRAPFLLACAQDPVLRSVRLIAEPWDVGQADSFVLAGFPAPFREWNGSFRDTVRDFWRSEEGSLATFATRFAGSSDLFDQPGRTATASINLVTTHDGFTLEDLVSYDEKHNEANGEDNADGADDNRSWNCGVEGPTLDAAIVALRDRQARALLATLVLASGVPMLVAGDELGRTQGGNNNAYCQDNETSWLDWAKADLARLAFTRRLLALRRTHRALRRDKFRPAVTVEELGWFSPDGQPMTSRDWDDPATRSVAIRMEAERRELASRSEVADDLLVLVNAWWEDVTFTVPDLGDAVCVLALDTDDPERSAARHARGTTVRVAPRSLQVLVVVPESRRAPRPRQRL